MLLKIFEKIKNIRLLFFSQFIDLKNFWKLFKIVDLFIKINKKI